MKKIKKIEKKNTYFGVGVFSINLVSVFMFGKSNNVATNNNDWATNHNMLLSIIPSGGKINAAIATAIAAIQTNTAKN